MVLRTDIKNERNKQKYRRKLHDEITTLSGSLRTRRLNGDLEIGQTDIPDKLQAIIPIIAIVQQ